MQSFARRRPFLALWLRPFFFLSLPTGGRAAGRHSSTPPGRSPKLSAIRLCSVWMQRIRVRSLPSPIRRPSRTWLRRMSRQEDSRKHSSFTRPCEPRMSMRPGRRSQPPQSRTTRAVALVLRRCYTWNVAPTSANSSLSRHGYRIRKKRIDCWTLSRNFRCSHGGIPPRSTSGAAGPRLQEAGLRRFISHCDVQGRLPTCAHLLAAGKYVTTRLRGG